MFTKNKEVSLSSVVSESARLRAQLKEHLQSQLKMPVSPIGIVEVANKYPKIKQKNLAIQSKDWEMITNCISQGSCLAIEELIYINQTKWAQVYAQVEPGNEVERSLIVHTPNIYGAERHGYTALIFAIYKKQKAIVELLINSGADLEQTDNFPSADGGHTPLYYAMAAKDQDIIMLLLKAGAKTTPILQSAIDSNNKNKLTNLLDEFINLGAKIDFETLILHAQKKETEIIDILKRYINSKNKDMLVYTLDKFAKLPVEIDFNALLQYAEEKNTNVDICDLLRAQEENKEVNIHTLLCTMRDYPSLNTRQANAFIQVQSQVCAWILQGTATDIPLPFDTLIKIASDMLGLNSYDTSQVILGVLNKLDEFKKEASPVKSNQVTTSSATLFAVKPALEKLDLIKNFILDELKSFKPAQDFKDYGSNSISTREYGFHLGISKAGLPYMRDRYFSIVLENGKVKCSKVSFDSKAKKLIFKEMTAQEITNEIIKGDSLIGQIVKHQEIKLASQSQHQDKPEEDKPNECSIS